MGNKAILQYLGPASLTLVALPIIGAIDSSPHLMLFADIDSYAPVHSVFVAISFAICALIFGAGWHTAVDNRSGPMALLSAAFLAVGLLELGHLLSFGGMPKFVTPSGGDKPLAFWLTARYAEAVALIAIAARPRPFRFPVVERYVFLAISLVYVALVYAITLARPDLLPPLFVEGHGLTPLKIWAEYGVIALQGVAALLLLRRASAEASFPAAPLLAAVVILTASEIAFTLYRVGYDDFNVAGHLFKLIAFALIYRVVFVKAVTEPYRRLATSEATLRRQEEHLSLIQRVAEIGSTVTDFESGAMSWSEDVYRMLGVDPSGAPSVEAFVAAVHPDDRAAVGEVARRALAGNPIDEVEFRVVTPEGRVRWFAGRADFVRDARGQPARMISTLYEITAHKAAEEKARRSQYYLQLAQRIGRVGSVEIPVATGESRWSDEMFAILGLDPATTRPVFASHLAVTHPDDREKLLAFRDRDHQGLGTEPGELRIIRPDGEVRTLLRRSEVVGGELVVTFQDISDRKKIEEALKESERLLREAARIAKIGVYVHDHLSDVIYWSPEQRDLYGIGPEEPIAIEIVLALLHPDDRARIAAAMARAHDPAGDGHYDVEHRILRRDGTVRWLMARGSTIFEGEGAARRPRRTTGATFDTTSFKEIEARLRRSERHLAMAQSVGRIGSAEIDLVGEQHHRTDEYCRLLGFDPAQVKPSEPLIFRAVIPEDHDKLTPLAELATRTGPLAPILLRIRRGDEIRWVQRYGAPILDAAGKATAMLFTLIDITEVKLAEERHILLERQLAQAQKMEAVGQLTGGVAHDFNNLLAVMLGRLQMLRDDLADAPRLRAWTEICIRAAERGASLTRSLLAFSRMQALNPVSIELNAVVADMTELLRRTLGETIEVRLSMATDLWPSLADPGQVQTALLNLAVNARDAMPEGGQLTVETRNAHIDDDYVARHDDVKSGDYVLLSVSDNGTGMPAETLARVFEPFFTTKGVGQGSGLGLSMIYGFARQSGGHVNIYSEPGRGTTVNLYLPRALSAALGDRPFVATNQLPRGNEKILVLEDNDEMRDLTQAQLERLGYRALTASDSTTGIEMLRQNEDAALLLSDIVLGGGVSGPQFASHALALRPDLAVVFMTGYGQQSAAEEIAGFDAEYVLQKPFSLIELAQRVRAAIDRRAAPPDDT